MDLRITIPMNEVRALIRLVQYYRYMWPRRSHVLAYLTEVDSVPKGREILWNNYLEVSFRELKHMVYAETLLNYLYWKIMVAVHTYASDNQLGTIIIRNDKPIAFILIKLINLGSDYATT